ncbi:glycosyl transferase family 39 [Scardovia inopinata]|uniref:Polyprenol-phosphate-mannose--protein mannosyltransferase n=2 Tax=Scardovia inopinata TaxID=78259 RepID=W5IHW3_SCAIO|nr:phospholipid carrier-dependent glycosyltransferase [Scardovia inopinata]EFG26443.2 hypothetical protein HMPREF9020_00062 [Scardovia inopinata F0304]BAR07484.1 glycosyltransferase [Scardovia inopinata JCM 12537]SUV51557.1 glycosyl transferase family 39 [Scardovia inopinata]
MGLHADKNRIIRHAAPVPPQNPSPVSKPKPHNKHRAVPQVLHGQTNTGHRINRITSHKTSFPGLSLRCDQLKSYCATPKGWKVMGWIIPLLVTVFGGLLRFIRLGQPAGIVFDETYYVKDAWTMLLTGEARDWPTKIHGTGINTLFAHGHTGGWLASAEYVVHPPLGKWFIALGLELFGGAGNIAAWRAATALAGTLGILLLCRVTLKLFHNLPLTALAGLFLSVDGLGIVMSRTGILDIFIMTLALGAFLCLLNHREWALGRLTDYADEHLISRQTPSIQPGPLVFFSWWRLAAAILLGLSCGIKWSGIYFFAVFALISVFWDAYTRHELGYKNWFVSAIIRDGLPTALYMIPTVALTYLATWAGWFIHPDSYLHSWAAAHPGQGVTWLPDSLRSFLEYHREMWQFHVSLDTPHTYMANAWLWPLQIRPTSFWWSEPQGRPGLCPTNPVSTCVTDVVALGNPLLWWTGSLCAILTLVIVLIAKRGDWRAAAVLAGWVGGWAPWLLYQNRTTFNFYAVAFLPWVILSIIYVLNWLRQELSASIYRIILFLGTGAILLVSAYFFPIWTAIPVPYHFWYSHMWLQSWI